MTVHMAAYARIVNGRAARAGAKRAMTEQRSFPLRVLALLGADVALLALFLGALATLIRLYGVSFVWAEGPITISAALGTGLIALHFLLRLPQLLRGRKAALGGLRASVRETARDWAPFIGLMWAFESLETYTGRIPKPSVDPVLYALDVRLFGVEPTVWIHAFHHPLLTDWMAFAYGSYFVLPMIIATALSLRGRREDFREMSSAVVIQQGLGLVLCLTFPAGPPRFYRPLLQGPFQPGTLYSYFGLFEFQQGAFDAADPARTRSAFPSLHCALALVSLVYAWRFGSAIFPSRPRWFFWICLPVVVSLWISTIYLRHHWTVDCAAGLAVGAVALFVAEWLRAVWPKVEPAPSTAATASEPI
jgi:membrane-associated phospholipid phosphatase